MFQFKGVMLASPTSALARTTDAAVDALDGRDGWVHELKGDGIRAVCVCDGAEVTIYNRRGAVITYRYPDVVAYLQGLDLHAVLDGEIVAVQHVDGQVRIDFAGIHRRDAIGSDTAAARLARTIPATFLPFDILQNAGEATTALPLMARRGLLEGLGMGLMPQMLDVRSLWAACKANGWEGIVSKRADSLYVPKRSKSWIKLKVTHTLTAVVTGYTNGNGSRSSTFGALRVGLYNPATGQLEHVGTVGSGFSQAELEDIKAHATEGILVEVEYLEVSPNRHLRQPVFLRRRTDVGLLDATVDQLETS